MPLPIIHVADLYVYDVMNGKRIVVPICLSLILGLGMLVSVQRARAEFVMNFTPDNTGVMTTINTNVDNGANPDSGQTPYLYDTTKLERPEIVTDPTNGNTYYHMIVGSLADGFIQESYVQMGFGGYGNACEPGGSASASGGTGVYKSTGIGACIRYVGSTEFGNGSDPLDMDMNATALNAESGNGTGNPTRVIMRQIMSDGEMMMEFLKDKYANKPRISLMLNAPDITSLFDLDMRHIGYNDATTPGNMVNTIELWGAYLPPDSSSFDMATEGQTVDITGGKYIYNDGVGFGGAEGTYDYVNGGYDQVNVEWGNYLDPAIANPWNFESAKGP